MSLLSPETGGLPSGSYVTNIDRLMADFAVNYLCCQVALEPLTFELLILRVRMRNVESTMPYSYVSTSNVTQEICTTTS